MVWLDDNWYNSLVNVWDCISAWTNVLNDSMIVRYVYVQVNVMQNRCISVLCVIICTKCLIVTCTLADEKCFLDVQCAHYATRE